MAVALDYQSHFDHLFFSCDMGCSKPEPSYFETVLRVLGVEPNRALFVDDNPSIVAAAVGMQIHASQFNLFVDPIDRFRSILREHGLL